MLCADEAWEGGAGGDDDMTIISASKSTVEVASGALVGWLDE